MDIKDFAKTLYEQKRESSYQTRYFYQPDIDCNVNAIRGLVSSVSHNAGEAYERLLEQLVDELGEDYITKIVTGDEDTCRSACIELLARQAAAEMCVNGKYKVKTFQQMSSLPIDDFKLVTKRIVELVNIANDVSTHAINVGVAGL